MRLSSPLSSSLLYKCGFVTPPPPVACNISPTGLAVVQVVRGDLEGRTVLRVSGASSCVSVCTFNSSKKRKNLPSTTLAHVMRSNQGQIQFRCIHDAVPPWTRGTPEDTPCPRLTGIKDYAAMQSTRRIRRHLDSNTFRP